MPRTREQNKRILEQRKNEIIESAITIFTVKDYKDVTIDDITNKLNISHGLFYHYFTNKKDLILAIIEHAESFIMKDFEYISKHYVDEEFFYNYFETFLKLLKNEKSALLINFLNNILKNELPNRRKQDPSILERFYNSAVYRNIKSLNDQGKLIQPINETFKVLSVLTSGLCSLATEGKVKILGLKANQILKTFIILN
jgi:AcrR family transcriptional regulator